MTIVLTTAMPYAAARLEELPNPITSRITSASSIQLTNRDIDLARRGLRGEQHRHARQVAQLDGLAGDRERTRNDRLRSDDRGGRCQQHEGQLQPLRSQEEERIADGVRRLKHEAALTEVIQQQARHHQPEPRDLDGSPAEVAHVRVERLAAGHCQKHGRHDRQRQSQDAQRRIRRRIPGRSRPARPDRARSAVPRAHPGCRTTAP